MTRNGTLNEAPDDQVAKGLRDDVLNALRERLGVSGDDQERKAAVAARLKSKKRNTIPSFGLLNDSERLDWFVEKAVAKGVVVHHANKNTEIADVIASLDLGSDLSATKPVLDLGLPIALSQWSPKTQSACCVSTCYSAIAESGTIVIASGQGSPISQIFLSDVHIVIVESLDIEDNMESVWQRMRDESYLPRHVTLVSGPSSTGDIELQMEQGAHGPRELHVILLKRSL